MPAPIQYTLGTANFYGRDFTVNRSTLIPRPETEQLVERSLVLIRKYLSKNPKIIDIGTGSGVIAITLKKELPDAVIMGTDISEQALAVAQQNASRYQALITFEKSNLFSSITDKFNVVIANLPYVPSARWRHLPWEVRGFEPKNAITGGRDGLYWIKRLAEKLPYYVTATSIVALEIDDAQSERVLELFKRALPKYSWSLERDLAGFNRFIFGLSPKLA